MSERTIQLGDGSICAQCGAPVSEKVVVEGEVVYLDERRTTSMTHPDTLGANLPCGHDAPAVAVFDAPFVTTTCRRCGCEMPDHAIYTEYHAEHCPGAMAEERHHG
jgi:hypothetical protein